MHTRSVPFLIAMILALSSVAALSEEEWHPSGLQPAPVFEDEELVKPAAPRTLPAEPKRIELKEPAPAIPPALSPTSVPATVAVPKEGVIPPAPPKTLASEVGEVRTAPDTAARGNPSLPGTGSDLPVIAVLFGLAGFVIWSIQSERRSSAAPATAGCSGAGENRPSLVSRTSRRNKIVSEVTGRRPTGVARYLENLNRKSA